MKKIVFYIVERPLYSSSTYGEYKDDEIFENSGLAPIEVISFFSILFFNSFFQIYLCVYGW